MTVAQLVSSLQITNQSWLEARHKRRVSKLREATGSGDTYVFDNMMMCCNQRSRIRKLEIFELQATEKDPVSVRIGGVLEIGHDFDMKKLYYGPINVECYDSGQDLLVFVHKQEQPGQSLYISLYSLRSLTPHPEAIEPVLCLPAHFIDGNLDAVFICGRSIGFVIQNQSEGDTVLVIRWKGASIFPAKFRLESPFEQILHMIFLDDDHPLVLTAPRSSIADQDYTDAFNYTPVKLRMLEVQEVLGNLSDALTLYTTSLLCQGPQFLFPPLKQNAAIDADMSWILPYHPSSPCTSKAVARRLKPSPYYDHAPHAGVFVIHLGGNLGGSANEEDDWQVQVTILKSEFLPWKDQPLTEVEWDTWGKDSTRIFQPRPDDSESTPDTLKACFMTWQQFDK
ncbi:hypothetical protein FRC20_009705 [Serendipita sp. 405]|nr:hypothetical protein FRC20_009705 [Serendipita sp. 405]